MVIRECTNPDCQFRYPDQESDLPKAYCPKCGKLALVSEKLALNQAESEKVSPKGNLHNLRVVLDNIRSIYNVGAIFRTADGFGVEELLLCGISPTPQQPRFTKTSLGAEKTVCWSYHLNAVRVCRQLQMQGNQLIALENPPDSTNLYAISANVLTKPVVLVLGNEVAGIDPQILRLCDLTAAIPMQGTKNSFNVATAFGIAVSYFYALSLK